MASTKIAVSLPESLFGELETAAAEAHLPRSQVIADALRDCLRRRQIGQLRERINAAYADAPDSDERAALDAHRRIERATDAADGW